VLVGRRASRKERSEGEGMPPESFPDRKMLFL